MNEIRGILAIAFVFFATACSSGAKDPPSAVDPFSLWSELMDGLVASPHDLEAEAQRLVASGDWAEIIRFVRDNIATVPNRIDTVGNNRGQLSGTRGILRSGVGTLRDKAELLYAMLEDAGFSPERRLGSVSDTQAYWEKVLAPVEPQFTPVWSDDLVSRGLEELGDGMLDTPIDESGAEAAALAGSLADTLAGALVLTPFDFDSFPPIPIVRFEADGQVREGNVLDVDTPIGEAGTVFPSVTGGNVESTPDVEVRLEVVTSSDETTPVEVVSHTWSAADVVGRQVSVQFMPAVEPELLFDLPLASVRDFVPAVSLRGHDMTRTNIEEETYTGDIVTINGDILAIDATGTVSFEGRVIETSSLASAADVSQLEVEVLESTFPTVQLRLAAFDMDDDPVVGLPASAFRVTEDGAEQTFQLLQNNPGPPRVMFLLDHSGSMPPEYDIPTLATLSRSIAEDIQMSNATAEFRVEVVGGTLGVNGWTTDLDAFEQAALMAGGQASNVWQALSRVRDRNPTMVVLISDGQVGDVLTPEIAADVAQLGPVLMVDVVGTMNADFEQIAQMTGGTVFEPTMASQIGPQAVDFISAALRPSYVLKYVAPEMGNTSRMVTVSLNDASTLSASGTYEAPSSFQTPTILRAQVVVTIDGESVTRILAGDRQAPSPLTAEYVDRVRRELLAVNILGFEVGDPSPHALARDLLQNKLNVEPLVRALQTEDEGVMRQTLLEGILVVPPPLLAALRSPPALNLSTPVYPTGLRAALYRLVSKADGTTESVDILPFNGFASMEVTSAERLAAALITSARGAVVEGALFNTSTLSVLEGEPLKVAQPRDTVADVYPTLTDPELTAIWEALLEEHELQWKVVPVAPENVAFWSIDADTGTVVGILSDGSGGGATDSQEQALVYLNMLDFAAGGVGVNWQVSFWISFSKAVLKQAIRATKAISTLGVEPPPPGSIFDAVSDVTCDMLKDKVFGALGSPGERIDFADSSVELFTGDGLPCTF